MSDHETLAAALAAFQAELPAIGKGQTAKVEMKGGGSYSYNYADLADVSAAILPRIAAQGLSFSSQPTFDSDGRFVLAYQLRHACGESIEGTYPLPNGQPQQVGSAITYARRYCLCAVTGVAPEDDDDDARAAQQASPPAPREKSKPRPKAAPADELGTLREAIRSKVKDDESLKSGMVGFLADVYETNSLDGLEQGQLLEIKAVLNSSSGREKIAGYAKDAA